MAKKTKEHAEITRLNLISAARRLFIEQGVTKTTMEQIAIAAGYTRGAVHWHFESKVDIFQAMRDLVSIPMVDKLDDHLFNHNKNDALDSIEKTIHELFYTLENDQATRETFIILSQCEYSGDFKYLKEIIDEPRSECLKKMESSFHKAKEQGVISSKMNTQSLAQITQSFITGTIDLWISDENSISVRNNVHETISAFINLLRSS